MKKGLTALVFALLQVAAALQIAAQLSVVPTDEHLFIFSKLPKNFETRVRLQGGEVVRTHPEIGLAVVRGLTEPGAAVVGKGGDFARDLAPKFVGEPLAIAETIHVVLPPGPPPTDDQDPTEAALFPLQWDMRIIDADQAWDAGFDDASGVSVAVLDTGIDPYHQDLLGLVDESRSVAFVPSVHPAGPAWGDDNFHGTHVAGTVASNGIGTSGVAPRATLIAVKVCSFAGSCPFGAVISGILHAANADADIINLSLGATLPKAGFGFFVRATNQAINYASRRGSLVVSAAANDAADLDHNGNRMAWPCEGGNGICVSATGATDAPAAYTNFGRSAIHVAGPGGDFVLGDLHGTTVLAPCSSLTVLSGFDAFCGGGSSYLSLQGTSMAAPHVAGAAALLDAQFGGGLNPAQLKTALAQAADDLGQKGTDPYYGKGRINVFRLVQ